MTHIRNSVRYLHGITNEWDSEGRNSVFVRYSVQEPVRGEYKFAVANCYARFQEIFGERVRQISRSPRTRFAADSFAANAR